MIFNIFLSAVKLFGKLIAVHAAILWNELAGVFEFDQFAEGTRALPKAIAESAAFSPSDGGGTLAVIDKYVIADQILYISTGGSSLLV